jgi:GNAT superfamily N-acetyltransferase
MTTHTITLRLARPDDAEDLRGYFNALSKTSRRNRFFGGVADQSLGEIHRTIGGPNSALFCMIATAPSDTRPRIVGECVCAVAHEAEIALSVDDAIQDHGIGRALLATVEMQAAQRGAREICGTILYSNDRIKTLARSRGYVIERSDDDWTQRVLRKVLPVYHARPVIPASTTPISYLARRADAPRAAASFA